MWRRPANVQRVDSTIFLTVTLVCRHKPLLAGSLVAGTTGLEPATSAVTGQRSNQLSYVPRIVRTTWLGVT